MTGPPNSSAAATEFTMRSAPTSFGFSTLIVMPVRTPGTTNTGVILSSDLQTASMELFTGGTTLAMQQPVIDFVEMLPVSAAH